MWTYWYSIKLPKARPDLEFPYQMAKNLYFNFDWKEPMMRRALGKSSSKGFVRKTHVREKNWKTNLITFGSIIKLNPFFDHQSEENWKTQNEKISWVVHICELKSLDTNGKWKGACDSENTTNDWFRDPQKTCRDFWRKTLNISRIGKETDMINSHTTESHSKKSDFFEI